tara:strand:+ start:19919 stop:20785 length:867 start_codon:yes stop_codon:yes gene_type:complete
MTEESGHEIRNVKRISPGVLLAVFILMVSALLIYKIQTTKSVRSNRATSFAQTGNNLSNAVPQPKNKTTQPDESLSDREIPDTALAQTTPHTEMVLTQTTNRQPLLPDVKTVKEGELESTSWQNPFYRLFWKSSGWKFTEAGMVSSADQISAATFLRPYQKISVSFRVDVEQKFPAFALQLLTRDPAHPERALIVSSIQFQNDGVSVSTAVQEATTELKSVKLDLSPTKPESVRIRFVGTGNRFVISVGGRRVLTCAQPAQQSGKECFLSFLSLADQVQISALRIEGE